MPATVTTKKSCLDRSRSIDHSADSLVSGHPGSITLDMPDVLRDALSRIATNRFRRGRNFWHAPGVDSLSRTTVARLKQRNVITIPYVNGQPRLELTVVGEEIVETIKRSRARKENGR